MLNPSVIARQARLLQRAAIHKRQSDSAGQAAGPDLPAIQIELQRLDPKDRLALELWARGTSHTQIAAQLGMTITAHRSRWQRLRLQLAASQS